MDINSIRPPQTTDDHRKVRITSLNSMDRLVMALVDAMLAWSVSASFAYWFVLLFRLPVWSWYPALALILGAVIYSFRNRLTRPSLSMVKSKGWALFLLLTCVASASINIFTNRPDSDDIAFSHRAFVAASNLSAPIAMTDTAHDVVSLPPITPLHVFTSVEVTTALVAQATGVPQLFALHLGLGSLANFMLPAVYFLLLRFFRVRVSYAVIGTVGILLFLAMSGNVHRDWGNFTFMRSWQGKCLLMEVILPLALLYSLRFHLYGRRSDAVRLHAVMCSGIGLSGTGLFLVPFVIGTSGIAVWVATRLSLRSAIRIGIAAGILFQAAIVSALPWLGILPALRDISFYITGGWPVNYAENLGMVFHVHSIPLYLAFLSTAFLVRRRIEFFAFIIYLGISLILLTAPGIRTLLMSIVTPGAYWRFAYALFVPLYVGLALAGLSRYIGRLGTARFLVATWFAILVAAVFIVKSPAVNHDVLSEPGLKFADDSLEQAYQIASLAKTDCIVLVPPSIVPPLGLLRPDVKFIVTRPGETMLAFNNAGRKDEGLLRSTLGAALESCDFENLATIRSEQLWPELSLVAYPARCSTERIRTLLALDSNWRNFSFQEVHVLLRAQQ